MALDDRSSLLDALTTNTGWLARSDITSIGGDLITLAEARIAYGSGSPYPSPPLRVRGMEASTTLGVTAQTAALPSGFVGARQFYLDTDPVTALDYLAPNDFWRKYMSTTVGKPVAFTLEGDNIVVGPTPGGSYTGRLLYWKKLDALSTADSTNWLLTNYPSVYLYAGLLEAAIYIQDMEKAQVYGALFMSAINGLQDSDKLDRYGGAPLQVRSDVSGN